MKRMKVTKEAGELLDQRLLVRSLENTSTLWRLMVGHGLRISEALALCAGDVDCGVLTINRLEKSK
jgi:integrase